MKVYNVHIHETGEEVCVVARSSNNAADVLVTFWVSRCGHAPGDFQVSTGAPAAYHDHATVQSIAAGDVAGVVVRQPDGSVLFEPAIA